MDAAVLRTQNKGVKILLSNTVPTPAKMQENLAQYTGKFLRALL